MTLRVASIASGLGVAMALFLPGAAEAPPSPAREIAQAADALRSKLVEVRRDLHRHPELAYHE